MAAGDVTKVVLHDDAGAELRFAIPELAYLPLEAAVLESADGARITLRGWGGRLWVGLHGRGAPGSGLDVEGLSRAFKDGRFAGLGSLGTEGGTPVDPTAIASMDGALHACVPMPVVTLTEGEGGVGTTTVFPSRRDAYGWLTFRGDRMDDAVTFAQVLARLREVPFAGVGDSLRAVFPLPRFDDVFLAFATALGPLSDRAELPLPLRQRIGRALEGHDAFLDASEATDCMELAREVSEALRRADGAVMPLLSALDGVMTRYEAVDRAWVSERDRPPSFAFGDRLSPR